MAWFERADFTIRYQCDGATGTPILLLHEMGMNLEAWQELTDLLSPEHRVIRLDLRGAGLSQRLLEVPQIDDFVEDIHHLLNLLDITEPVLVVGGAAGGAIGLAFSSRYSERTLGVIAGSPAVGVADSAKQMSLGFADTMEASGLATLLAAGAMNAAYPESIRQPAERYQRFKAIQHSTDGTSCANIFRMVIGMNLTETLAAISCPVLLIGGRFDGTRPPEVVQQISTQIPGARVTNADVGHFISIQNPPLIHAFIKQELAKLSAST